MQDATWDEVDFENAVWSIPKERMKRSKPHNVYLAQQSIDILIALKTCSGNSRYLLPSRYDADEPMSRATFNRLTAAIVELAKKDELLLSHFTVHDLRRTGSTLLNEVGFQQRLALNHQTAKMSASSSMRSSKLRLALNHQTAKITPPIQTGVHLLRLALNHQTAKISK